MYVQEAYQKRDELQSFTQRKEIEEKEVEKERQGLSSAEKNIQELKEETNQLKHKVHETNRNMEVNIRQQDIVLIGQIFNLGV